MSSMLYGSPPYGRSVAGVLQQVPSSTFTPCPPGLPLQAAGAGFHTQSLSFGPPATVDHISQCAHPCSPSVHDCTCVSGGAMNTYEVAPDPSATVRHCHDDRSASGVHESSSVSCDQHLGSGP
eukprot:884717-Amphidinium_carterae.1